MYDELTKQDIEKMEEEIEYRKLDPVSGKNDTDGKSRFFGIQRR